MTTFLEALKICRDGGGYAIRRPGDTDVIEYDAYTDTFRVNINGVLKKYTADNIWFEDEWEFVNWNVKSRTWEKVK